MYFDLISFRLRELFTTHQRFKWTEMRFQILRYILEYVVDVRLQIAHTHKNINIE